MEFDRPIALHIKMANLRERTKRLWKKVNRLVLGCQTRDLRLFAHSFMTGEMKLEIKHSIRLDTRRRKSRYQKRRPVRRDG